jgi:hypothetical protein
MSYGEELQNQIRVLLGCEWGRTVWTPDDTAECNERAEGYVVVHDGPKEAALKLCPKHRDRILQETTPREEKS